METIEITNLDLDRLWCKQDGILSLDYSGFLLNPDAKGSFYKTDVFKFDDINHLNCLILLGEPDMGKSNTIRKEFLKHKNKSEDKDYFLFIDLNEYGDENRLINEIFKSNLFSQWITSDRNLHLYFDSFDECLLEIRCLSQILKVQINNFIDYKARLYIRITSRTGMWSNSLSNYLINFFGKENTGIFELAPLMKDDVLLAAQNIGINNEKFIQEVIEKELQPLAIIPLTLKILLCEFIQNNHIISTKEDLFYAGCKFLCTEPKLERQFIYKLNTLSPEKKMALASRIAAIMIFCDKSIIDLSNNTAKQSNIITIDSFLEEEEYTDNFCFNFTQQDLIETITQTSLFSKKGDLQFTFYHLAYTEYLAAKYITNHKLSINQINSLITISTDEENKIIPQVKGVAKWLSIINSYVFDETIKNDPQNLLNGELDFISIESKEKIVNSLLDKFGKSIINDTDWGLHKYYQKLNHPKLSNQLKPIIKNKNLNILVRKVAIDIAYECELTELNKILLTLVLNKSEDINLRVNAIHTLIKIGDLNIKRKLIPLATKQHSEDIVDDLKGYSLRALWPEILQTKDVFNVLTFPKIQNSYGGYMSFLNHFNEKISVNDIDVGLDWILKNDKKVECFFTEFDDIEDKIINLAWSNFPNIEDKSKFAKVILQRMQNYKTIFPNSIIKNNPINNYPIQVDYRLTIFKELINLVDFSDINLLTDNYIIKSEDFYKLIDILKDEKKSELKSKIAKVLGSFNYSETDKIDIIITYCESIPELHKIFENWFKKYNIDSDEATQLKKIYNDYKNREEKIKSKKKDIKSVDIYKIIENNLEKFEETESLVSWYQFFLSLTINENSGYYGDEINSNVLSLSNWNYVDEPLKNRIINAAKIYINTFSDNYSEWFNNNIFFRPATAGYKSLVLLIQFDMNFIQNLTPEVWIKWSHILIDYPETYNYNGEDKLYKDLISIAYSKIPNEIIDITIKKINIANEIEDYYLIFLQKLEHCFDERFQLKLFEKAKEVELNIKIRCVLLSKLLDNGNLAAQNYLKKILVNSTGNEKVLYAKTLTKNCNSDTWSLIKTQIEDDFDFGKNFFLLLAENFIFNGAPFLERITEMQCANLFLWLIEAFPREEDPVYEGVHYIDSRESIGNFREDILRFLSDKGTAYSIPALNLIKETKKDLNIDYYIVSAKNNYRKNSWEPLIPKDFLKLTNNSNVRIILNTQDLLNLIIDSLKKLETILQGSNSLSENFWNKVNSNDYVPKSEEHISDNIKQHLDRELNNLGISSYREVQLRKPNFIYGGKKGENTDIYISFTHPKTKESFNVIIEVKGSNNKDINTNMKTQLSDRYLNTDKCKYGIYLITWYNCNAYKKKHSNKTNILTLEDARIFYSEEAKKLSTDEKNIFAFVLDCSLNN